MLETATTVGGLPLASTDLLFLVVLALHIPAGLTAVISGALAARLNKRGHRHARYGTVYFAALTGTTATAAVLAILRRHHDWHLFLIAVTAFALAATGRRHHRLQRPGHSPHIFGMGGSYILLLTGFLIDNGPHLPLWNQLPTLTFWIVPTAIGLPLLARATQRARGRNIQTPQPGPAIK